MNKLEFIKFVENRGYHLKPNTGEYTKGDIVMDIASTTVVVDSTVDFGSRDVYPIQIILPKTSTHAYWLLKQADRLNTPKGYLELSVEAQRRRAAVIINYPAKLDIETTKNVKIL